MYTSKDSYIHIFASLAPSSSSLKTTLSTCGHSAVLVEHRAAEQQVHVRLRARGWAPRQKQHQCIRYPCAAQHQRLQPRQRRSRLFHLVRHLLAHLQPTRPQAAQRLQRPSYCRPDFHRTQLQLLQPCTSPAALVQLKSASAPQSGAAKRDSVCFAGLTFYCHGQLQSPQRR